MTELVKVKKQLRDLQQVEVHLREQVNMYSDKYGEFQDSLKKSHNIFVGYKGDMEKMSKKIKNLEKDSGSWKSKWEKSNAALLDLLSEKQIRDEHIHKTARQMFQLQKLCRQLQNERTAYFSALEQNSIEIPAVVEVPCKLPEPEPEPEKPTKKEDDRLEIMTANCSALKANLAALQGQLSEIQLQNETAEATKQEQPAEKTNGQQQQNGQSKKGKKDKKGKQQVPQKPSSEQPSEVTPEANGTEPEKTELVIEAEVPTEQPAEVTAAEVTEVTKAEPEPTAEVVAT